MTNDAASFSLFVGPKARLIPARGNAPGIGAAMKQGLKARPMPWSAPNVLFVPFDAVPFQELAEFVFERLLGVMRFLGINVRRQGAQVSRADGEDTVTHLPREIPKGRCLSLEPFGGRRFQFFNQLGDGDRPRQTNRKMDVVRYATSAIAFASGVSSDRGEVRMQIRADRFSQPGMTVLGAEDNVDQHESQRLCHGEDYRSGLQPSGSVPVHPRGVAPGWYGARLRRLCGLAPTRTGPGASALRVFGLCGQALKAS